MCVRAIERNTQFFAPEAFGDHLSKVGDIDVRDHGDQGKEDIKLERGWVCVCVPSQHISLFNMSMRKKSTTPFKKNREPLSFLYRFFPILKNLRNKKVLFASTRRPKNKCLRLRLATFLIASSKRDSSLAGFSLSSLIAIRHPSPKGVGRLHALGDLMGRARKEPRDEDEARSPMHTLKDGRKWSRNAQFPHW